MEPEVRVSSLDCQDCHRCIFGDVERRDVLMGSNLKISRNKIFGLSRFKSTELKKNTHVVLA